MNMKHICSVLPLAALAISEQVAQSPLGSISSLFHPLSLDAIPPLGFGTWNLKETNTSDAVAWAIQVGYRHIDCAAAYGNEDAVGKGIADGLQKTGLKREDLWITSKLWNDHHDPSLVEKAIDTSLNKLGLTYLDLYHMHWPVASSNSGNEISYLDTWSAMALLRQNGKTRHIGVSNFSPSQLSKLLAHNPSTPPSVHQMELHPYLRQSRYLAYHANHSIHVTAYSPLGGTNPTYDGSASSDEDPDPLLKNPVLQKIAQERNCSSPAQVALSWGLSPHRGTSIIPKSIHKDRIEENFQSVTACALSEEDLDEIDGLGRWRHRFNNPSASWKVHLYEGLEDDDGTHGKAWWWDAE